jgi:hypothetical protein
VPRGKLLHLVVLIVIVAHGSETQKLGDGRMWKGFISVSSISIEVLSFLNLSEVK